MLKPAWTTQYPDVVSWMVFKTQGNNIWSTQTSDSTVKGAWIWEKTQITSHFVISFSLFFFYLKKIKIKMYSWNQNKTPYYTSALKTDGRTRRHGGLDCVSWFVRSTQGYSRWANQESAKISPAVADGEGGREGQGGWCCWRCGVFHIQSQIVHFRERLGHFETEANTFLLQGVQPPPGDPQWFK